MDPYGLLIFREAISSAALSHPEGHSCEICRASHGDSDALAALIMARRAAEAGWNVRGRRQEEETPAASPEEGASSSEVAPP